MDNLVDGITAFASLVEDTELGQLSAYLYRDVRAAIDTEISESEACPMAFGGLILLPNKSRRQSFTVLTENRVVVAWRTGFFRKVNHCAVVPYSKVRDVTKKPIGASSGQAMMIDAQEESLALALPANKAEEVFRVCQRLILG